MQLAILFYCQVKNFTFFFAPGFNWLLKFLPGHKVGMTAAEWGFAVTANHTRCLHCIIQRYLAVSVACHVANLWSVNKINNISDSSKTAGIIWKACHDETGHSCSFSTFAQLENSYTGKTNRAQWKTWESVMHCRDMAASIFFHNVCQLTSLISVNPK